MSSWSVIYSVLGMTSDSFLELRGFVLDVIIFMGHANKRVLSQTDVQRGWEASTGEGEREGEKEGERKRERERHIDIYIHTLYAQPRGNGSCKDADDSFTAGTNDPDQIVRKDAHNALDKNIMYVQKPNLKSLPTMSQELRSA